MSSSNIDINQLSESELADLLHKCPHMASILPQDKKPSSLNDSSSSSSSSSTQDQQQCPVSHHHVSSGADASQCPYAGQMQRRVSAEDLQCRKCSVFFHEPLRCPQCRYIVCRGCVTTPSIGKSTKNDDENNQNSENNNSQENNSILCSLCEKEKMELDNYTAFLTHSYIEAQAEQEVKIAEQGEYETQFPGADVKAVFFFQLGVRALRGGNAYAAQHWMEEEARPRLEHQRGANGADRCVLLGVLWSKLADIRFTYQDVDGALERYNKSIRCLKQFIHDHQDSKNNENNNNENNSQDAYSIKEIRDTLAVTLGRLGDCYFTQQNYGEAFNVYNAAVQWRQHPLPSVPVASEMAELSDRVAVAVGLGKVGEAAAADGRKERAHDALSEAMERLDDVTEVCPHPQELQRVRDMIESIKTKYEIQ